MKYNPPPGSQDPNAPYVNGIPGVQKGSPVNANAVEYPQREILSVITAAGIAPTNNDLTQLYQAIVAIIMGNIPEPPAPIDVVASVRNIFAGCIVPWPTLSSPVLSDGLPLGLSLDGAVADLTVYSRLSRVLCLPGNNAWMPAWYRCDAAGNRTTSGTCIKLDDWRGGTPRALDLGRGIDRSTILVNTTSGSANITIINNLSAGGTLTTYDGAPGPVLSSEGCYPGIAVSGAGIPAGAVITSVSGLTVTLSAPCTATAASVEVILTGRVLGSWQGDASRPVRGTFGASLPRVMYSAPGPNPDGMLVYLSGHQIVAPSTTQSGQGGAQGVDSTRVVPTAPVNRAAGPAVHYIIMV